MENNIVTEDKKSNFNLKKEIFEWFYTILIAVVIAIVIKTFLFDFVVVDGPSMYPTLKNGDRLIVTKLNYEPERQDIIVLDSAYKNRERYYNDMGIESDVKKFFTSFSLPDGLKKKYYVKRIIGMPGDTVDLIGNKVYVNGEELLEEYYPDYTFAYDPLVTFPLTVSENMVFVMGDNRPESKDSRSSQLGEVPMDAILGKCSLRIWPLNSVEIIEH